MEHELEYSIAVKKETEFDSLFSEYIVEIDENGKEVEGINDKWIPFHHDIHFVTKTISYIPSWKFEAGMFDAQDEEESLKNSKTKKKISEKDFYVEFDENDYIIGTMQLDPDEYLDSFSMFGTKRELLDLSFRMRIGTKDSCRLIGWPQYSYEADFYTEIMPDSFQIEITFKAEKFRRIVDLVCNTTIVRFPIRLGQVAGLYAPWSPSSVASAIKILTPRHQLDDPSNIAPHFRSLGVVGDMDLSPKISQNLFGNSRIPNDIDPAFDKNSNGFTTYNSLTKKFGDKLKVNAKAKNNGLNQIGFGFWLFIGAALVILLVSA